MGDITATARAAVIFRASQRCEYCGLAQVGQEAAFHIDHIVPRIAGGSTNEHNLALACVSCSLHKAAKQSLIDPASGEETLIFNPRSRSWAQHFRWDGNVVAGLTATGSATISGLKMNHPLIIAICEEEKLRGRHPHI